MSVGLDLLNYSVNLKFKIQIEDPVDKNQLALIFSEEILFNIW